MAKNTNKLLSIISVMMMLSMAFIGVSLLTDDEDSSATSMTYVVYSGSYNEPACNEHYLFQATPYNVIQPTLANGSASAYTAGSWSVSSHGLSGTLTISDCTSASVRSGSNYVTRYGCTVNLTVSGTANGFDYTDGTVGQIYLCGGASSNGALQTAVVYVKPTYLVTISAGTGGTVSGITNNSKYYAIGETTTISATANSGYTFSQWNDGNTNASRTITVSGTATYTASFTPDTWTVTYDLDGGTLSKSSDTVTKGSSLTLPTPTRSGYNFTGWYSGTTLIGTGGASYTPSADITLKASWEQVLSISSTPSQTSVLKGSTWTYTPTVNTTGYTLSLSSNAPSWLSVNGSSIQGTPGSSVTAGTYTFTVFCQKTGCQTAEQSITLTVVSSLVISNPTVYVIAYEG